VKKQVLVFRSFAELGRKALPVGFVRRCDRRGAEQGADKPVTEAQARALAAELLRAFGGEVCPGARKGGAR
jgi:hypothetical protein